MPSFRESSTTSIHTIHAYKRTASTWGHIVLAAIVLLVCGRAVDAQPGTGPGGVGDTSTPVSLKLWLESGSGTFTDIGCTTAATDTSSVACWEDQSGNGNDATQSIVVRQPIYRTDILNATNGQAVLRFDGSTDFMVTSVVPATGASGRTLIAVINNGTDNGEKYQHITHYGSGSNGQAYGLCFETNALQTAGAGSNVGNHYWGSGFSSNLAQTTSPKILAIQYDGTMDELFADGATQGTKTIALNTTSTDGMRLASRVNAPDGDEFFAGDIAELIAYGTLLTTPQRILIENYLSAKFDIPLAANDKYVGDLPGNGDHDLQVAGIGRESGTSNSDGISGGLFLSDNGFLQDDGDYLLAGHDTADNSPVVSDLPVGVAARSQRIWYLATTDINGNGGALDLTFDFAVAGLGSLPSGGQDFHLLARNSTSGDFTSIATSTNTSGDQVTFSLTDVTTELVPDGPYVTVGFTPNVDLAITKTDGQTTVAAGSEVVYTVEVTNNGSDPVVGATVTDTFPVSLSSITWTCSASAGSTCTAGGSGDISDTVDLLAGGTATYTITATLSLTATGDLINTATVTPPMGTTDPVSENDSATDTDTIVPAVDLSITKDDGQTLIDGGDVLTYTITVSYPSGGITAEDVTVTDTFPAALTSCSWTCVASGGATCTAGPVAGNLSDTIDLPVASSVTYTAVCTVAMGTIGILTNTATVTVPAGTQDPQPGDNSATDVDLLVNIFLDGFESGDLTAWSRAVGASAPAAFDLDQTYSALRASFYFDPASIERRTGEVELLSGFSARGERLFAVEQRRNGSATEVRLRVVDDTGAWHVSSWSPAPAAGQLCELEWLRAPHEGSLGGALRLTIDGRTELELAFINNHQRGLRQLWAKERADGPVLSWESVELE